MIANMLHGGDDQLSHGYANAYLRLTSVDRREGGGALDTLNILSFPFLSETRRPRRFSGNSSKIQTIYGLGTCRTPPQLNISRYEFWRKELHELVDMLSLSPCGKAQLLLTNDEDGRNLPEVWTFFSAIAFGILVIVGVVTCVYSAV